MPSSTARKRLSLSLRQAGSAVRGFVWGPQFFLLKPILLGRCRQDGVGAGGQHQQPRGHSAPGGRAHALLAAHALPRQHRGREGLIRRPPSAPRMRSSLPMHCHFSLEGEKAWAAAPLRHTCALLA